MSVLHVKRKLMDDARHWQPLIIRGEYRLLHELLPDMVTRITDEIQSVDPDAKTIVTVSGCRYQLHGSEGCTEDMFYDGLVKWMVAEGIAEKDVQPVSLEEVALAVNPAANRMGV